MLWQRIIFLEIYLLKKDNFLRDSMIYVWVFGWIQALGLDLVLIQVFGLENQNLFSICFFFFGYQELNWFWGCSVTKFTICMVRGERIQSVANVANHIFYAGYRFSIYNNLSLNMYLQFYVFLIRVNLYFFLFIYRTSIGCFCTYIFF